MYYYILFALMLSVVGLIFALQNAQNIAISFISWHFYGSLSLVLIVFFAMGFLAGIFILLPGRIRSALHIASMRRQLAAREKKHTEDMTKY